MNNTSKSMGVSEASTAEPAEKTERTYAGYGTDKDLAFDPMKDLNLPGSYEEVQARLGKLQSERTPEALN